MRPIWPYPIIPTRISFCIRFPFIVSFHLMVFVETSLRPPLLFENTERFRHTLSITDDDGYRCYADQFLELPLRFGKIGLDQICPNLRGHPDNQLHDIEVPDN